MMLILNYTIDNSLTLILSNNLYSQIRNKLGGELYSKIYSEEFVNFSNKAGFALREKVIKELNNMYNIMETT